MRDTFTFADTPGDGKSFIDWFRALPQAPNELHSQTGSIFHFQGLGDLALRDDHSIDGTRSPIVKVVLPTCRLGALWTLGEVRFLPTAISRSYPELYRIRKKFESWISKLNCIYRSGSPSVNSYNYYLEGSSQNGTDVIWATPAGLKAIEAGPYFVNARDNEILLNTVARRLRLRGVDVETAA